MFGFKLLIQSAFVLFNYALGGNGDVMPIVGGNMPVGGQRDPNDCLIGAGFTWCEETQNCIRRWETPCADNYADCNDCLKRQRNGENIACPTQCDTVSPTCETDEDCGNTHFCRPTTMNIDGPKECVLYSEEGDSCGGYTLPAYQSRCKPSFECANTAGPMIADAPGTCMRPCDPPGVRDAYGNCRSIRGPPIMVPGPVLTGTVDDIDCNSECMPLPCVAPGPDCEYTPPEPNECGCATECGEINCYAVYPLPAPMPSPPTPSPPTPSPPTQVCSEVMCMMYCENGWQIDENGCNMCACNSLPPDTNNQELCPIPYQECNNEYVCPKVTEITHCGEGGISGYTTYQLSLVVQNPNIMNIYALFGDNKFNTFTPAGQLVVPGAYQVSNIFGTNLGGVPESTYQFSKNSMYDSWLTIGITDGDPENKLGTIGIDFESWNLNTPLIVDNGAVFLLDPEERSTNLEEIVVGQLTIPNDVSANMILNVQGKFFGNNQGTWKEYQINFEIVPPVRIDGEGSIPDNCSVWYDGCNTCQVRDGQLGACTRMMCFREDTPYCMNFNNGH